MTKPRLDVAVGIFHRADGCLFVQERPAGTVCAGQWEFPGGKLELGETAYEALQRELYEELGVDVSHANPLIVWEHDYDHADVRLSCFLVKEWTGELSACEGQRFAWMPVSEIRQLDLLDAAIPLLDHAESVLFAKER